MKFVAAILADLETTPLGTRSRLADDLVGTPVLRRTVQRVLAARCFSSVHVLAPLDQAAAVARLLDGLPVQHERHVGTRSPHAELVRAGRWWGLDGWRGGIGSMCVFDEDVHIALLAALVEQTGADAVIPVPAAAAVADPALLDAIAGHFEGLGESARITIVQAPPGLAAVVLGRVLLQEMLSSNLPPGALLTYHPDQPAPDGTGKEICHRPAAEVIEARGRLLCDTRRGFERVADLLADGGEAWPAARIGAWLMERHRRRVEAVPEEIEIELTTDDPDGDSVLLRPRGVAVGRRGPIELDAIARIAEAVAGYDDVRIVLGGFGEPCRHPRFAEICRALRRSAASLAVRTNGTAADPAVEDVLFETPVDVIEVTLDAATPETYRRVYGMDRFGEVSARLERWIARRASSQRVRPLIVPSLVKALETFDDLEPFYDTWQRRLGAVLVTGYSHCARQRPDRAVTSTAPPHREPCRRVRSRALILADGRMTTCDQDFAGRQAVGRVGDQDFAALWHGVGLEAVRRETVAHGPLCGSCDEWHRP